MSVIENFDIQERVTDSVIETCSTMLSLEVEPITEEPPPGFHWSWKGFLAAFLVCGGLAWVLSAFVDRWLGREYAGFWHTLRDRLRTALG